MTMESHFHSVQKLFETHGNYFLNAPPSTEKLANEVNFSTVAIALITKICKFRYFEILCNESAALPLVSVTHMEQWCD